jgi:nucleotide-binding universal stress UspA family protein
VVDRLPDSEETVYRRILVAIEHSPADETILEHVEQLAHLTGASLLLVHVADGWAARHYEDLNLRESEEMRDDRAYLARLAERLRAAGLPVEVRLTMGDPATELVRIAETEPVDLVAMATHGHRLLGDLVHGTTADRVRHRVRVPVLMLRTREQA